MPKPVIRPAKLASLPVFLVFLSFLPSFASAQAPAVVPITAQSGIQAILPNGRQIRPAGNWIPVAPYPFAIALKPDGSEAAIPSIGFPFALNIVGHPDSPSATVRRLPGFDALDNDPNVEVHAGVAYSADGQILYVATGNSGKIDVYSTGDWRKIAQIPLDGKLGETEVKGSFAASVLVSADGQTLYVLDQGNFRVAVVQFRPIARRQPSLRHQHRSLHLFHPPRHQA
jgi:DNA-binding beta-propeller fold protein YncE